jgi:hypothetical protein
VVISHIIGGVGNQMFQYAAGKALALATGQQHYLDINDFSDYKLHNGFELNRVFNLDITSADQITIAGMLGWRSSHLVRKILRQPQLASLRGKKFVVQPYFNYWPDFFSLTGNVYLHGYWQSESYFKPFESIIRQNFTFREPLEGKNLELSLEISGCQSVSLHVRRGDYINDSKTARIMDVCSLEYYLAAVDNIAKCVKRPVFYIFSDDIDWVKKNLPISFPCVYVDHNRGAESYRDMQLMSLCKHNVIANSSFSWWGAWLNDNPGKIVVAPKTWFCNGTNDSDLIPAEWVRL